MKGTNTRPTASTKPSEEIDRKWCIAIAIGVALWGACWLSFEIAYLVQFGRLASFRSTTTLQLVGQLLHGARADAHDDVALPEVWLLRTVFILVTSGCMAGAFFVRKAVLRHGGNRSDKVASSAHWATSRELSPLLVDAPGNGRVILGRMGRNLLALEQHHSVMVVGPTQSGKTSGFVIPAILEWEGPIVATSVKTDLIRSTYEWRKSQGDVSIYDPAEVSGYPTNCWSPLSLATTWPGAKRAASGLCSVARSGATGLDDASFWYATAEKLIAPLLFAAARSGASMVDVVRWVDTEEVDEVLDALMTAGVDEATQAAVASFRRDERQRSSVFTTAETILSSFSDSTSWSKDQREIDPQALLNGGANTLYLVAPVHEQERLQSAFVALLRSVIEAAYTKSSLSGRPLAPSLLVVLDEAANIAPLNTLDSVASVAASHGVQLLTVWQDLAQITSRYGGRATTVVNNHRAKLICSGVSDPATLDQMSMLIGDEEHMVDSSSTDKVGGQTVTRSSSTRRLAPADVLRRMSPGEAVLLYGHHAPARLALRPHFREPDLVARSKAKPNCSD